MKNLYLLTTKGLGQFHVIANDPTQAQESLLKILDEQDYGFKSERQVTNIEWITEAFKPDFTDKSRPFLSSKENRLLIVGDWA